MSNQEKIWQILPKISQDFIKQFPDFNQAVLQLLYNRGLTLKDAIEQFLNTDYNKQSHNPFLFQDMKKAVELIIKHIKNKNKIVVYGDYDADGVTASALLVETLKTLKAEVDVYIPNRVSEGYGLNKKAIDELVGKGAKLIITVDSGIRNKLEVKYIKGLGIDIIITDHHELPEEKEDLPDCLIIDPIAEEEEYPFKYLSGVGVAFKLAKSLISESTLSESDKQKLEEKIFDLVAIGTVADCVSLINENRALVQHGLEVINKQKRVGLRELIKIAKINNHIDSWNIAWQIAPRLNVAGRLEHANTAYELLITKDKNEAQAIARRLNDKNIERQKITKEIVEYCRKVIDKELLDDKLIVLVCPKDKNSWPEGIIGLVAGRLCEQYSRPVIVITKTKNEFKGSGRSIDEFNIIEAVEQTKKYLLKFGGHAGACGFTIDSEESLTNFIKETKKIAKGKLENIDLKPKIVIDAELELSDINEKLIKEIEKLAPFGEGNPRPKFVSKNVEIRDIMNMGIDGRHVKFRLNSFWAVAFNQAKEWQDLRISDKIDIVYYMEMNEFNGRSEIQLKVVDIKSHNS